MGKNKKKKEKNLLREEVLKLKQEKSRQTTNRIIILSVLFFLVFSYLMFSLSQLNLNPFLWGLGITSSLAIAWSIIVVIGSLCCFLNNYDV